MRFGLEQYHIKGPKIAASSRSSMNLSLQVITDGSEESQSASMSVEVPTKRVRLSFPPEKYADLSCNTNSYGMDVRTRLAIRYVIFEITYNICVKRDFGKL